MRNRDSTLTIALCASLVVHAMISIAVCERYVWRFGAHLTLPALSRHTVAAAEASWLPVFDPDEDPARRLGDTTGTGSAIDSSPGETELLARQGPIDQPFLSRDPAGLGNVGDPPTESLIAGNDSQPAPASPPQPPPDAPVEEQPLIGIPAASTPPPPKLTQPQAPTSDAPAAKADEAQPAQPGGETAADPAPQSESEVDPFAATGSVEFRRGNTQVRFGRKHRITRPRLSLAAQMDLISLGRTRIVLKIRTNDAGDVSSVEIEHRSGSDSLDQIIQVTAYEWWFEPPTDSKGKPRADTFLLPIGIQ